MNWEGIYAKKGEVQKTPIPIAFDFMKKLRPNAKILDVGCGTGRHLMLFAENGFNCSGIDQSPTGLRILRRKLADSGLQAVLKKASFRKLPFRANSFDAVFCTSVLHHDELAGCAQGAKEIIRVLKPGGILAVDLMSLFNRRFGIGKEIELNTFVPTIGLDKGVPHHFFSKAEVVSIFSGVKLLSLKLKCLPSTSIAGKFKLSLAETRRNQNPRFASSLSKSCKWVLFARK